MMRTCPGMNAVPEWFTVEPDDSHRYELRDVDAAYASRGGQVAPRGLVRPTRSRPAAAAARVAIENLRAAGLNAQAEALAREAEAWMRERSLPPGRPPEARDRPDIHLPGAHLKRAVQERREQMQDLRRQI